LIGRDKKIGEKPGQVMFSVAIPLPSGKQPHNYGKSPCYQWENPLQIAIFNSYFVYNQRVSLEAEASAKGFLEEPVFGDSVPEINCFDWAMASSSQTVNVDQRLYHHISH